MVEVIEEEGFNITAVISDVIQKFNKIEAELKEILTLYINPSNDKRGFTQNFLLHNSIISFAGKLKLFKRINNEEGWMNNNYFQDFYRLLHIRNAFAHSPTTDIKPSIKFPIKFPVRFQYHVELSHSKKVFELLSMEELYKEFNNKYQKILDLLIDIKKELKSS